MAKAGNLNLDFMAQKHRNSLFCFEYTFRCYRDTKTLKKKFGRIDTLRECFNSVTFQIMNGKTKLKSQFKKSMMVHTIKSYSINDTEVHLKNFLGELLEPPIKGGPSPEGGGGIHPYKGLMGMCGQPGYVFRDFCLKQGIKFIIFCLNQGIGLSIFVLNRMSFLDDKQQNFYKRLLINIWVKCLKQGIKT